MLQNITKYLDKMDLTELVCQGADLIQLAQEIPQPDSCEHGT
jgi:hypothetical protein